MGGGGGLAVCLSKLDYYILLSSKLNGELIGTKYNIHNAEYAGLCSTKRHVAMIACLAVFVAV